MSAKVKFKILCVKSYRRLPIGLRDGIRQNKMLNGLREHFFLGDSSLHDQYYSVDYYDSCEERKWSLESASYIASDLIAEFHPRDIIDVGCGLGDYMTAFQQAGVKAFGVELASDAVKRCLSRGLEVVSVDLTNAAELPWRADIVYSVEVAEHLPASGAQNFVRLLPRPPASTSSSPPPGRVSPA